MSRGRKKTRKIINPLVEHIADYSDMEFADSESGEDIIASRAQEKIDRKCEDETDRMWMYKDVRNDDEVVDDEEVSDEELWGDEDKKENEKRREKGERAATRETVASSEDRVKQYMDAAVWFKDISERGIMSEQESRYVELMIIELSKFYFDNIQNLTPSMKCLEAIKQIGYDIKEAGL